MLGGSLEYQIEGQPPTTLEVGDVLLVGRRALVMAVITQGTLPSLGGAK